MATWPSGEAEACKALHRGSIPLVASVDVTDIAGTPGSGRGSLAFRPTGPPADRAAAPPAAERPVAERHIAENSSGDGSGPHVDWGKLEE